MSRKVKTPRFLMRSFSLNIWFILSVLVILTILFAGLREIDNTVYKENRLKIKVTGNNLIVNNYNKFEVGITILNNSNKFNYSIKEKEKDTQIELLTGINKVFIECEYFEDVFEVSTE